MKYFWIFLEYLAGVTFTIIFLSIGEYLLKNNIIHFRWSWLEYPYYIGLVVLLGHALNILYKQIKK